MSFMNDPIAKKIASAKITLLLSQPFFGNMATGMSVILTDNENHTWCKTAATDGRKIYFNRDFVKSMTFEELVFVVAHEVLHAVFDHLGRRQGRDPEYYNMAGDYVINYTLDKSDIGVMPPVGLLNKKYTDEWTAEQVYDDLVKNQTTIEMGFDQHLDGDGGASSDKDGNGGSDGKKMRVTVNGDGDGPPVFTADELEEIRQEVLSRTIQAVQAAEQQENAGYIPAAVKRMIADLTEPKMDWRTMLDCQIRSQMKNDYTFQRLSRVELGGGFIFPAEDDDLMAEADIWIDTSGSMGQELLQEIMSEVKGIMQTFGQFKLRVGCFDAKAYKVHEFNERNIDEVDDFPLEGGGGTMFTAFWQAMMDAERVPERLIVFTDGYPCDSWGEGFEQYCETLWVVHGGNRAKAPFGLTVFYEDAEK